MTSKVLEILKHWRVQLVIGAVLVALVLVAVKGLNTGIEFKGGVRIPISVVSEQDLSAEQMAITIDTLKQRINKFGLSQSVVRPLGGREIIVEIPQADAGVIANIEKILKQQGKFQAVIDGNVALEGQDIVGNAVGGPQGESVSVQGTTAQWDLSFAATRQGGERFSKAALGKANFPVYMYLDRPAKAAILADPPDLSNASFTARTDLEKAIEDLRVVGGDELLLLEPGNRSADAIVQEIVENNKTQVIFGKSFSARHPEIVQALKKEGYSEEAEAHRRLVVKEDEEMRVNTYSQQLRGTIVNQWKAVGLLSAPVLSEGLANGYVSQFYSVSGTTFGNTPQQAKESGLNEIKLLKSVISGGKLPVSTVVGSAYVVSASLGEQFLLYSGIAVVLAIIVVMSLVVWRYKRLALSVPIVLVNLAEIVLTTTFIGVFGTLDLAAVAGIIAIVGEGVADQIIITDELLRKGREEAEEVARRGVKERIGRAFFIILTAAGVAIVSMLPLLLSGIVEVMGFALATIVGLLIGVALTRPAFGIILEKLTE